MLILRSPGRKLEYTIKIKEKVIINHDLSYKPLSNSNMYMKPLVNRETVKIIHSLDKYDTFCFDWRFVSICLEVICVTENNIVYYSHNFLIGYPKN